jgi:hypothetical protein
MHCNTKTNRRWCTICGDDDGIVPIVLTKEKALAMLQNEINELKNGVYSIYSGWTNLGERFNYLLRIYKGE